MIVNRFPLHAYPTFFIKISNHTKKILNHLNFSFIYSLEMRVKQLNPKCPLEIYYEKITLHIYFSTQFCVLNVAKAT